MKSIVIRRIPDEVFEWIQAQANASSVFRTETWLRLKLIEMAKEDLKSPLVWENNQDGESIRVVKK